MKALIASDLHFEFHRDQGQSLVAEMADADVLLCPGDLSDSEGLLDALVLLLGKYKHVAFTYGNHEFYHSSIPEVKADVQDLVDSLPDMGSHLGQLHVLDNSTCEIEGRRFVGTTMWFRDRPGNARLAPGMNDFHVIRNAHVDIYRENEKALSFLEDTVTAEDIVLTHHLPAEASIHPRWKGAPLNCFFLCDVEPLIQDRQPKIWIHGHTHDSVDCVLGTTQVVCNPFGYAARQENPAFNPDLIIEI